MMRIADKRMTTKVILEDFLAGGNRLFLGHVAKTIGFPGRLRTFDDKGRGLVIKLIGVRPDPTLVGFLENKGKGIIEFLMRAQPDKLAFPRIDIGLEFIGKFTAGFGIKPVGCDDKVKFLGIMRGTLGLGLEPKLDTQFTCALLQQDQKLLAPDAAKTMSGRYGFFTAIQNRNIIPI